MKENIANYNYLFSNDGEKKSFTHCSCIKPNYKYHSTMQGVLGKSNETNTKRHHIKRNPNLLFP